MTTKEEMIKLLGEIYTEIENREHFTGGDLTTEQRKKLWDLELIDEEDDNIIGVGTDGFYDQLAVRFALKVLYALKEPEGSREDLVKTLKHVLAEHTVSSVWIKNFEGKGYSEDQDHWVNAYYIQERLTQSQSNENKGMQP